MRKRINFLVAATTSLVLLAFLVPLALLVRDVAATRAMAAATVRAQSLAPMVANGDRGTVRISLGQIQQDSEYPVSVLWPDGTQVGAHVAVDEAIKLAQRGHSITVEDDGGREILVAVQGSDQGTAVIRSFVSGGQLRHGVVQAWTILLLLGAGLLAAAMVVADRLARSMGLQMTALAAVSHRLSRGELDTRVMIAGPPEIRDVGAALNNLAARIEMLMAGEREAAADLSHRLRTPLTVLRLEAESLRDPAEAERLSSSVDGLERTVTYLINETRRPDRRRTAGCDAADVVAHRVAFWSVLADEQDRKVGLAVPPEPVPLGVSAEELAASVDALLENVFAHTPEGTAMAVTLHPAADGEGPRLEVADDGPGFGNRSGRHLVRRGASTASSSGLGLDIVRRTAEATGGTVRLGRSAAGGACVSVQFGALQPRP